jgi:hypothetical protein
VLKAWSPSGGSILGVDGNFGSWGLVGGSSHWASAFEGFTWSLFPSSPSAPCGHEVSSLYYIHLLLRTNRDKDHGRNALKLGAKINPFSFKSFMSSKILIQEL